MSDAGAVQPLDALPHVSTHAVHEAGDVDLERRRLLADVVDGRLNVVAVNVTAVLETCEDSCMEHTHYNLHMY